MPFMRFSEPKIGLRHPSVEVRKFQDTKIQKEIKLEGLGL